MALRTVTRDSEPEIFKGARREFTKAIVCDCGWHQIGDPKDFAVQRAGEVHRAHFCPHRCN